MFSFMALQHGEIPLSLVYFYRLRPFASRPVLSIIHQVVTHKRYDISMDIMYSKLKYDIRLPLVVMHLTIPA